jgi:hypothetical protein
MNLKTWGFLGLLLASCNRPPMADSDLKANDTVNKPADKLLAGLWTDGSGPNATFTIQGDTIRDVESNTRTKFIVHGDSVTFLGPDPKEVYSAKMYLTHDDTLVYEFSGVKTKYWRFKD